MVTHPVPEDGIWRAVEFDAAQLMEPIAHGLTPQQVLAVAAYLGSLE